MTVLDEDARPGADGPVRDPVERIVRQLADRQLRHGLVSLARQAWRPCAALAAATCYVWMYATFFVGPSITVGPNGTVDGTPVTVQCAAPSSYFDNAHQPYTPAGAAPALDFAVLGDGTAPTAVDDIQTACDRARVASCAVIAILGATSGLLLTALALAGRRRATA